MVGALEGLGSPVCVCTEGLFAYLNDNETKTVIRNIYRLLQKYGGCWITVDPETLARHMAVFTAIAGKQALEILKKEISGFSGESKIDVAGRYTQYLKNNHSTPEEIHNVEEESKNEKDFRENGFLVEKIPFVHGQYDLRSFSFLKDDVIEKLRKALSNVNVWKLTVNPDFVSENPGSPEKNFSLQTKQDGEILSFILTGRMDSLSAPLLLDAWEKESVAQTVQKVIIDCNNLQYVSSAGLRVLMMIKKALPEAPLVLMNVNRPVKEILVTTGFIGLFEIHCKDNNRNDN